MNGDANRVDRTVEDRVRHLESHGIDAKDIHVHSPIAGTRAESIRTGTSQLGRPLQRALTGLAAGLPSGALLGAAVGASVDLLIPLLVFGAITGGVLGALTALYARLPMSSRAFDADGARSARIEAHDTERRSG